MLADTEAVLLDLDGTVFQGDRLIRGAKETIASLQEAGKRIAYLSNRGNVSRKEGLEKLERHGIMAAPESLILSSTVTASFLKQHYPKAAVWPLGNRGLAQELLYTGVKIAQTPEEADFVVVTLHDKITYEELNAAFKASSAGARMIATNADKTYPDEAGQAIDVAGFIGAIEAATGRKTELVIGKPSCFMAEAALTYVQAPAEKCLIVGDSLESDIGLGRMQGMKTALVLTGNTRKEAVELLPPKRQPDYVLNSIDDLRGYL
ncbi:MULTISPECIES: HAD-IIA family hydrolase [Shouchella]|uniref:HAD-IIA family hydrolase n=1 Tax=Shouchella rhizosphaerae TaxID=866786 RepID=A0ABZ2CND8_9BACI|nr:HAD-IIA family hydrolase [Shouchella clausii]PAD14953.1 haloacid dehalogenase [Shouchella clausii]